MNGLSQIEQMCQTDLWHALLVNIFVNISLPSLPGTEQMCSSLSLSVIPPTYKFLVAKTVGQ